MVLSSRLTLFALVPLLCALVVGCAELVWVRAGTTAEQLDRDQRECQRQAFLAARDGYESDRLFAEMTKPKAVRDDADRTALDRYHREISRSDTNRTSEERRFFVRCMKALGYREGERGS